MKSMLLMAMLLTFTAAASAQVDQDFGIPDSIYVLPPQLRPDPCFGQVIAELPIYLMTDYPWSQLYFEVSWNLPASCHQVKCGEICDGTGAICGANCDNLQGVCQVQLVDVDEELGPGGGVVLYLVFWIQPGDTLALDFDEESVVMGPWSGWSWTPTYRNLDTAFVAPTHFDWPAGDADASGEVDIDDVIWLIEYIFTGACAPWLQLADADTNCIVDIDDVVYLIAYIFAGGPEPVPGCVEY
jgi:hypothetical protein